MVVVTEVASAVVERLREAVVPSADALRDTFEFELREELVLVVAALVGLLASDVVVDPLRDTVVVVPVVLVPRDVVVPLFTCVAVCELRELSVLVEGVLVPREVVVAAVLELREVLVVVVAAVLVPREVLVELLEPLFTCVAVCELRELSVVVAAVLVPREVVVAAVLELREVLVEVVEVFVFVEVVEPRREVCAMAEPAVRARMSETAR